MISSLDSLGNAVLFIISIASLAITTGAVTATRLTTTSSSSVEFPFV